MKHLATKSFIIIFLSLFIIVSATAQKVETEKVSRTNADFTTTPFQDGNQAKGMTIELENFQAVRNGEFEEGNIKIKLPTTFNPKSEDFSIDGKVVVLKMKVYDMLGDLVYEGELNETWKDEKTKEGLYIYTLDVQILPNKVTKLKGFIRVEK